MGMKWTEPRWKSYIVRSGDPLFTPEQCDDIIRLGQRAKPETAKVGTPIPGGKDGKLDKKKRITEISWIPFNEPQAGPMYNIIEQAMQRVNINHMGFDLPQLTEMAQYTHYPTGAFYDWHTDSEVNFVNQPCVRKISMTILLNDPKEFKGGNLQFMDNVKDNNNDLKRGEAVFFASFIRHRITPVTKGDRKSLVMWFGGPPLK